MPQSLSKIALHIVFSTKLRENCIASNMREGLFGRIAEICRKRDAEAYRVGGTENHIHIACSLPRIRSTSELVRDIKSLSSLWMKEKTGLMFSWQAGYGAFSVSYSHLPILIKYIQNQQVRHQNVSFEAEFIEILEEHEVPYDQKYLWD